MYHENKLKSCEMDQLVMNTLVLFFNLIPSELVIFGLNFLKFIKKFLLVTQQGWLSM